MVKLLKHQRSNDMEKKISRREALKRIAQAMVATTVLPFVDIIDEVSENTDKVPRKTAIGYNSLKRENKYYNYTNYINYMRYFNYGNYGSYCSLYLPYPPEK